MVPINKKPVKQAFIEQDSKKLCKTGINIVKTY